MTEDLFVEKPQDQQPLDPNKNYLEELVGEGKKFSDAEALAKGKAESDNYIKNLEARFDEFRTDYERVLEENKAAPSLRELLDQLKTSQQRAPDRLPTQQLEEVKQQPSLNPDQFQSLFNETLEKHEVQKQQRQNFDTVQEKLAERFGSNAQSVLKQQAKELGLTPQRVNELAKESPQAFFRVMGLDEKPVQETFMAPPRSTQRSDNFSPKNQTRNWSFYEKMRKENPKLYHDPKTHVQMHKDADTIDKQYGAGSFMR